ncbi:hypothetical protein BHM03_00012407 [Ensete ventricosum]|nr:hypothetical protein BHM03_00012407 [Ensete ventricosum]
MVPPGYGGIDRYCIPWLKLWFALPVCTGVPTNYQYDMYRVVLNVPTHGTLRNKKKEKKREKREKKREKEKNRRKIPHVLLFTSPVRSVTRGSPARFVTHGRRIAGG